MIDDMKTVAERYASAIESSNLRTRLDRRCDTDIPDGRRIGPSSSLGANLARLRSEFDSAKAEVTGQAQQVRLIWFWLCQKCLVWDLSKTS